MFILPTPEELARRFPSRSVVDFRNRATKTLTGQDSRIAIILGPCSIHNPEEALEYGSRIKELQKRTNAFLIMRVFCEKPRTRFGWKGMLYDPFLDGSNDLAEGLTRSRKLFLDLAKIGVPCATEFLDPLIAPYLSDLITWGLIGARTAASQPHRQLASGLPFPVGFKNGVYGELEPALSGILSARTSHTHFSINPEGRIAAARTKGNPLSHLVLRGSEMGPNCDPQSIQKALQLLKAQHLEERLVIDCAHGNSGKDLKRQRQVFERCVEQLGNPAIRGLMLESNIHEGRQSNHPLAYGVSITDPCLGWEETEDLILSMSMSSVQK